GTWGGFLAHLHTWDDGRVRYLVGGGYANLNLDWFGQDNAFNDHSFAYNLKLWGEFQKLTMKIAESDFFWGVEQRYATTSTRFIDTQGDSPPPDIGKNQLDTVVSGLGVVGAYDTRNSMFSPTQGQKALLSVMQDDPSIGSDFKYTRGNLEDCAYVPLGGPWV